jgi:flagellar assembly protein FliH
MKFTFDLDLGRREERNATVTETAMAALLNKARAEGYNDGLAAGEQASTARSAKALAAAAEALATHVATMSAALDDDRRTTLADATQLAGAIGRKLATALLAREPTAEIEALIADCLTSLDGVPHLVIRCHPALADAVRELAAARIATSGFTGRLIVLGDPETALGDGKIEWVDGGVTRNRADLEAQIDGRIAAYLAAKGATSNLTGEIEK